MVTTLKKAPGGVACTVGLSREFKRTPPYSRVENACTFDEGSGCLAITQSDRFDVFVYAADDSNMPPRIRQAVQALIVEKALYERWRELFEYDEEISAALAVAAFGADSTRDSTDEIDSVIAVVERARAEYTRRMFGRAV